MELKSNTGNSYFKNNSHGKEFFNSRSGVEIVNRLAILAFLKPNLKNLVFLKSVKLSNLTFSLLAFFWLFFKSKSYSCKLVYLF